jgi:hypothetical protein
MLWVAVTWDFKSFVSWLHVFEWPMNQCWRGGPLATWHPQRDTLAPLLPPPHTPALMAKCRAQRLNDWRDESQHCPAQQLSQSYPDPGKGPFLRITRSSHLPVISVTPGLVSLDPVGGWQATKTLFTAWLSPSFTPFVFLPLPYSHTLGILEDRPKWTFCGFWPNIQHAGLPEWPGTQSKSVSFLGINNGSIDIPIKRTGLVFSKQSYGGWSSNATLQLCLSTDILESPRKHLKYSRPHPDRLILGVRLKVQHLSNWFHHVSAIPLCSQERTTG